jgi:quercetin dioxygenase-like cupin family protein
MPFCSLMVSFPFVQSCSHVGISVSFLIHRSRSPDVNAVENRRYVEGKKFYLRQCDPKRGKSDERRRLRQAPYQWPCAVQRIHVAVQGTDWPRGTFSPILRRRSSSASPTVPEVLTMTIRHELRRTLSVSNTILALAAFFLGSSSALLLAQAPAAPPAIDTKILMREPLGDTSEPKMSLFILNLTAGLTIPTHSHAGAVFAYILQGDIENQVEPDSPVVYNPGGFFHERPMQVHRLLRNLSKTDPANILIFQNTGTLPSTVKPLIQEPLANIANQEVTVTTLVAAPGGATAGAHQHPGAVFAYVLKGEIESQVDPDPPKIYRAGDVFYEPAMHAHRLFRNLSKTEPAELLIFQVGKKGEPLVMSVEK